MGNIKVEDVEIAIREMLEEGKIINPESICLHMGILPIITFPLDENGKWVPCINNQATIYSHICKLHEMHIVWRAERKKSYEDFREGYEKASIWDGKQEKMIYYKDKMSYEEFVDMRIPKRGIILIPSSNSSKKYIIPNPEEEKQWHKKTILAGTKTIKTRIESGIDAGHIKDSRKARKLLERFEPSKQLDFKETEEED